MRQHHAALATTDVVAGTERPPQIGSDAEDVEELAS